jgi:branched-chain amino acid transport system substrate-binding protein
MVKQRWFPMGVVSPGSPGMYEEQFSKALGPIANYCISNAPWFNPKTNMTKVVKAAFAKANPKENFVFHGTNVVYTYESILSRRRRHSRAKEHRSESAGRSHPPDQHHRPHRAGAARSSSTPRARSRATSRPARRNLNGEPRVVLPESAAEAKPVFPAPDLQEGGKACPLIW